MVFSTYSDTASDVPEEWALATDFTSWPQSVSITLSDIELHPWTPCDNTTLLLGITSYTGQWSTASWDTSCEQMQYVGSYDSYSSVSPQVSFGGSEWLPSGTDSVSAGEFFDLACPVPSPSYPGGLPSYQVDHLPPAAIVNRPPTSAFLDRSAMWPSSDDTPSSPTERGAFSSPTTPGPSESNSQAAVTALEDWNFAPPVKKKRYPCPHPRCRQVWKTAQALAYALLARHLSTTTR